MAATTPLQAAPLMEGDSGSEPVLYSNSAMGLLFFLILALIPTTYGMGAASGVFVPTLVAGAAGGRLVGKAV
ncbi:chloride channel protein, partial [Haematococcus lacustris]